MTHFEKKTTLSLDIIEDEKCDSMTTNYDEREFMKNEVPIDQTTPLSTSVMLMNSYFDFIYAKALCDVKDVTIRKKMLWLSSKSPISKGT